jgi:hypothetical protein
MRVSATIRPTAAPSRLQRFSWISPTIVLGGLVVLLFVHGSNWLTLLPIPAHKAVIGIVDKVVGAKFASETGTITAHTGTTIEISGWAASASREVSVNRVTVIVGGKTKYSDTGFYPRPDVAASFARPDAGMSGWKINMPLGQITAGTYSVSVQAATSDGHNSSISDLRLIVIP